MTQRLADALQPFLESFDGVVILDRTDGQPFSHFLADITRPTRTDGMLATREVGVLRVHDSEDGLDALSATLVGAPAGAIVAALLAGGARVLSADAVVGAVTAVGVEVLAVTPTVYPSFPVLLLIRRTPQRTADVAESLVAELEVLREAPEGSEGALAPVELPPEARARLDRMRAESARLRQEVRAAQARAVHAEKSLRWAQASTAWKIGRLLVGVGKRPSSVFALPRELWALWRLRIARRRGKGNSDTPAAPAGAGAALARSGSALLRPRLGPATTPATPMAAMSIVAVVTDQAAATLARYAAVVRVSPHNAADVVEAVDPDLVLIDSAVSAGSGPWQHLGNPGASDKESAALAMVNAAHDRGRPVALLRTGDLSLSAGLLDLAAECDLVVTDTPGRGLLQWDPGIDLPGCWAPGGAERAGVVWFGDLSLRMPAATRAAVLDLMRQSGAALSIHPRSDLLTAYPVPWPDDLRGRIGAPVADDQITALLAHACSAIVPSVTGPMALRALAAGARPVGPDTVDDLAAGPLTDAERADALAMLFDRYAAPARLRELYRLLRLPAPRSSRDVAVVCPDADPSIVPALLRQNHRPRELAVLDDAGLDEVQAAGIMIRRAPAWSTSPLPRLVDSAVTIQASTAEIRRWPRDHIRRTVIRHEVGEAVAI